MLQILEAVLKDALPANIELKSAMVLSTTPMTQLVVEVVPLVVEIEDARIVHEQRERAAHEIGVVAYHEVENLAVRVCESNEQVFHRLASAGRRAWRSGGAYSSCSGPGGGLWSNVFANNHE